MALIAAKATEKRKPPFLPDEVFEKLKCSDCKGYLSNPPIFKHREFGSICGNCTEYSNTTDFIRNTEFEILANFIEFPCKNVGCHKRILFGKSSEHDFTCHFKLYDCPFDSQMCHWTGFYQKIGTHFAECHKNSLIINGSFKPNLTKNCEEIHLDQRDNKIFLVQSKCIISECKFWCLVRYFGLISAKNKVIFKYKLEFRGDKISKPYLSEEKAVLSDICFLMDKHTAVEINIPELLKTLNCPTSVNCIVHVRLV